MKKFNWFVYGLIVIFLFGCGSSVEINTFSEEDRGGESPSLPVQAEAGEQSGITDPVDGGNEPVNIRIPSENDPVPSGILEQISWGGKGGGEGGGGPQDCGPCDVSIDSGFISFSNFQPFQELEVLIYRYTGLNECKFDSAEYVTTLSIQVDEEGNFSAGLSGPTEDLHIVTIFDFNTGEKTWRNYLVSYGQVECSVPATTNSCPGAPPQRLKVDEMAYVCTASDSVKLREGPSKSYPVMKSLVPGADIKIIDGPKCSDNWSWWEVETESGYTGWMAEGGDNEDPYFLCPAP